MFAGHIGAALALGRAERRLNLGLLVAGALLLDTLLWVFVLLGWETVRIPADFAARHQPEFVFPYSHSLLASVVWSVLAGSIAMLLSRLPGGEGGRSGWIGAWLAAAVFSHWLLDALVHAPEMPLAGEGTMQLGLGLWNHMALGLAVEALVVVAGLALYLHGADLPKGKVVGLVLLAMAALAFSVLGMTVAPAPPSAAAMAITSLINIAVVCALAAWLGRASPAAIADQTKAQSPSV
jgi:hypothetical protein